eukprot:TRINITY_DN59957_c0_g1_i1.p1 TRINITY_DN59957_c0_g1~~TRINITY_DN59957_c0_g1_i1.p1  ORF type:complete len:625 (+),score=243.93 TRINITY_DN59957_c0_g1_i1:103-1875(+)
MAGRPEGTCRPLAERIRRLDDASREMRDRAVRTLELHLTDTAIDAQRKIMRMRRTPDSPPTLYRIIRGMFSLSVDVFYHFTEVIGQEFVPPSGNATIMCPNHGNSLTDAVVCVSQSPRMVRLTAKDTLFKVPFFGWFVRGTKTIPFQRKDEHDGKADNKKAVNVVQDELLRGTMVCLFPEGRSRFHWRVDGIQAGVATIAYDVLMRAKAEGKEDYTISLLPAGLNYLHREKFRSGLVVEFGPPVVLSPSSDVLELERREAITKISHTVQDLMSCMTFHAEDWSTLRAAHTARNIFAPLGTQMTMVEFVKYTKYWCSALAINDPDDPTLAADLGAYQDAIDNIGVNDKRISRPPDGQLSMLSRLAVRFVQCAALVPFTLPGVVLWAPTFFAARKMEKMVMKRTKKPTHRDEVAQHKLASGWVFLPMMVMVTTIAAVYFLGDWLHALWLPFAVSFYMWFSIRLLEEAFAGMRAMRSLYLLLFVIDKGEHERLRKVREGLFERIVARAELAGDIKPPEPEAYRGFWFNWVLKLNPVRRRKKDWNEVLRLYSLLPVDQKAIEQTRATRDDAAREPPHELHPLAEELEQRVHGRR